MTGILKFKIVCKRIREIKIKLGNNQINQGILSRTGMKNKVLNKKWVFSRIEFNLLKNG